jgi:hypothetical protein
VLLVAGVALFVASLLVFGGRRAQDVPDDRVDTGAGLTGVESFADLSRNHVREAVQYAQTPPVGGDHAGTWQNCGAYDEPIVTELGVHSLEHGAVWVTYRADLDDDSVEALAALAETDPFVLVSPWEGALPAPVVASAWGRQLRVEAANDARLRAFVAEFAQGEQTPEPGAPCTGGAPRP